MSRRQSPGRRRNASSRTSATLGPTFASNGNRQERGPVPCIRTPPGGHVLEGTQTGSRGARCPRSEAGSSHFARHHRNRRLCLSRRHRRRSVRTDAASRRLFHCRQPDLWRRRLRGGAPQHRQLVTRRRVAISLGPPGRAKPGLGCGPRARSGSEDAPRSSPPHSWGQPHRTVTRSEGSSRRSGR
jgi:hypothetical protein